MAIRFGLTRGFFNGYPTWVLRACFIDPAPQARDWEKELGFEPPAPVSYDGAVFDCPESGHEFPPETQAAILAACMRFMERHYIALYDDDVTCAVPGGTSYEKAFAARVERAAAVIHDAGFIPADLVEGTEFMDTADPRLLTKVDYEYTWREEAGAFA